MARLTQRPVFYSLGSPVLSTLTRFHSEYSQLEKQHCRTVLSLPWWGFRCGVFSFQEFQGLFHPSVVIAGVAKNKKSRYSPVPSQVSLGEKGLVLYQSCLGCWTRIQGQKRPFSLSISVSLTLYASRLVSFTGLTDRWGPGESRFSALAGPAGLSARIAASGNNAVRLCAAIIGPRRRPSLIEVFLVLFKQLAVVPSYA